MALTVEALTTMMRPLVTKLERALPTLIIEGGAVPTTPVPKLKYEPDGSGKQWVENELDSFRLRLDAMPALEQSGSLTVVEHLIAKELGVEPAASTRDAANTWAAEREVINVFLELYLTATYGAGAHTVPPSPFDDPSDIALTEEVKRLHEFLSTEQFSGALLVMATGVAIAGESLRLDADVEIVPFSTKWRDALWAAAGWGSMTPQPLQSHDFFNVTHGIAVSMSGPRLDGWKWGIAQRKAERARQALLLCGARTVTLGISWLSHDERFASYLGRLGTGNGIVRQPFPGRGATRTDLNHEQTAELATLYPLLADAPEQGPFALALRRLLASAERVSAEDRLIDCWIAFEALFAADGGTELSFRAALRIAQYVGLDPEERHAIFDGLRKAYEWRSRIVHGAGDPTPKKQQTLGPLDDALAISEDTLRRALRSWLLAPPSTDLREIDHRFLD